MRKASAYSQSLVSGSLGMIPTLGGSDSKDDSLSVCIVYIKKITVYLEEKLTQKNHRCSTPHHYMYCSQNSIKGGKLTIGVLRARNLVPKVKGQKPAPYAIVSFNGTYIRVSTY